MTGARRPARPRPPAGSKLILTALALLVFAGRAGAGSLIYAGTMDRHVLVFDEAREQVAGRIPLTTGIPRSAFLSENRRKLYVTTPLHGGIEIVDLGARRVVSAFTLDEGNRRFRLRGLAPDPQDKLLYVMIEAVTKQTDRYEVERPKFAVIDLQERKIVKTYDYPKEESGAFVTGALRVSPDGKYLYQFRRNVLIFDTSDFRLVEKIELERPNWPGMEHVALGPGDDPHDEPGVITALFHSTDPIVRRRVFGIARFDLLRRTFDFTPVGPSTTSMQGLRLSPDRKTGYTVAFRDSLGNRKSEFWVFDMATKKLVRTVEFPGPVNFQMTLSGDGKSLYIHGSSPYVDVYDASSLQLRKTLDLQADLTTRLVVVPE